MTTTQRGASQLVMDLAIGAENTWVMMTLFTRGGDPKLVPECSYPLTGLDCLVADPGVIG